MKIKLTLSYDGTEYKGWQSQTDYKSVQQTVISAIKTVTGEDVKLTASGRTDAGVHAEGQVASFITHSKVPPQNFARALNTKLPGDIRVLKSERVSDDFNARASAKRKTYRYSVYLADTDKPLKDRYALRVKGEPDVGKMINAGKLLVGEHDFKTFSATGSVVKTSVRTIYSLDIVKNGENINFYVCGNGFLYNMVRIVVSTLIKVGQNKISEQDVVNMLEKHIRPNGIDTIPVKGLCLLSVEYE